MNFLILILHTTTISLITLLALRFGKELLVAWLALLTVAMNLFVLKQITLFGLNITCSDALAVGYLLALNLIQEFFGKATARKTVWSCFFLGSCFLLLAALHLSYIPSKADTMHGHFVPLFALQPRLVMASLATFLMVQFFDLRFFGFLKEKSQGKHLVMRTTLCLLISQTLDTVLFSFLGLYGYVESIAHILFFSLAVKGVVIALSTPFVALARRAYVSV